MRFLCSYLNSYPADLISYGNARNLLLCFVDKLFKEYGFVDAFSLDVLKNNGAWFADSHLAIDQGPIVVMIENYRSQLLWNLFMSAPEIKTGMKKLGFNAPRL